MLRHLGLIAVCACIVTSVGCDGGKVTAPSPFTMTTVEFGGRVVNADAGDPIANVRVSVETVGLGDTIPAGWVRPTDSATSGGDGTFTLALNLPTDWRFVNLGLTGPKYDDRYQSFKPTTAADRPAIRMYPTLAIRPGESIQVRLEDDIVLCWDGYPCRRILMAGSPGDPVELEIVPDNSSQPMYLSLATQEHPGIIHEVKIGVRLMVPPGRVPIVINSGTARLTARR